MKLGSTMAAVAAATMLLGTPVFAQMQSGMNSSDSMQSGSMGNSTMAPKMSKMQMKQMDKCKAMSPDMAAKNKTCAKMMKMHPEMMGSSSM